MSAALLAESAACLRPNHPDHCFIEKAFPMDGFSLSVELPHSEEAPWTSHPILGDAKRAEMDAGEGPDLPLKERQPFAVVVKFNNLPMARFIFGYADGPSAGASGVRLSGSGLSKDRVADALGRGFARVALLSKDVLAAKEKADNDAMDSFAASMGA